MYFLRHSSIRTTETMEDAQLNSFDNRQSDALGRGFDAYRTSVRIIVRRFLIVRTVHVDLRFYTIQIVANLLHFSSMHPGYYNGNLEDGARTIVKKTGFEP